ncbi:hypothetical protein FRC17_000840, partial [Serendipita sp. 399]
RGQLEEAETMEQEVLALRAQLLGPRHLDTAWAMANLAVTVYELGKLEEAHKLQIEVLALRMDILGPEHPDTIDAKDDLALIVSELDDQEGSCE